MDIVVVKCIVTKSVDRGTVPTARSNRRRTKKKKSKVGCFFAFQNKPVRPKMGRSFASSDPLAITVHVSSSFHYFTFTAVYSFHTDIFVFVYFLPLFHTISRSLHSPSHALYIIPCSYVAFQ